MEKSLFYKYGKIIVIFIVCEIAGVALCNILGIEKIEKLNFVNSLSEKMEFKELFFDVLISKTKIFIAMAIICASVFCKYVPVVVGGFFGFSYGVIACVVSAFWGAWYFVVILFVVIGHMAVYGYSLYILYDRKKGKLRFPVAYFVFFIGILLETLNYSVILYEISGK